MVTLEVSVDGHHVTTVQVGLKAQGSEQGSGPVLCELIGEPIKQSAKLIGEPIKGRAKTGTLLSTGLGWPLQQLGVRRSQMEGLPAACLDPRPWALAAGAPALLPRRRTAPSPP